MASEKNKSVNELDLDQLEAAAGGRIEERTKISPIFKIKTQQFRAVDDKTGKHTGWTSNRSMAELSEKIHHWK